jgi:hypothetical protein
MFFSTVNLSRSTYKYIRQPQTEQIPFNDRVSVLLSYARDDHDHAIRVHRCAHDHARSVNRYDHVHVYVHACVREYVHACAHESEPCLHECVRAHVHVYVCESANACVHASLSFHFSFLKSPLCIIVELINHGITSTMRAKNIGKHVYLWTRMPHSK